MVGMANIVTIVWQMAQLDMVNDLQTQTPTTRLIGSINITKSIWLSVKNHPSTTLALLLTLSLCRASAFFPRQHKFTRIFHHRMSTINRKDGSHLVACPVAEYETQFSEKIASLRELISWKSNIEAFSSPPTQFRMRANFQLKHDDTAKTPAGLYYAMFDEANVAREVKQFPRGSRRINELMPQLLELLKSKPSLFSSLFEARFLTTQSNEALIVLCYRKPLPTTWQQEAEEASVTLNAKIIGRARKQKQVAGGGENVTEELTVDGRKFQFLQTEGAFSQPNAAVCEKMIGWAMQQARDHCNDGQEELLELYCGGGTFTIPMATVFKRVLATEISKASVDLAQQSIKLNNTHNIQIARLSSEEFTEAYTSKRVFRRLEESGISIASYNISTVLVDPPRAGLDLDTCKLIAQFEKIIYISCNPQTLARDLKILSSTHDVLRVAAFDQFPYTHHLESGVFLKRRENKDGAASAAAEEEPDKKKPKL